MTMSKENRATANEILEEMAEKIGDYTIFGIHITDLSQKELIGCVQYLHERLDEANKRHNDFLNNNF